MNNYPITNNGFNRVIQCFNKWIKIRRKYNKRFLNKETKFSDYHINFIQSKVNTKPSFPIAVKEIWNELESSFDNIENAWQSTISRSMKNKLKLSYKKFSKTNAKNFRYESMIGILKSSWLLSLLSQLISGVLYIVVLM